MSGWRIPLSDVDLGPEEARAVSEVIESGWLTLGPRVRAFEDDFAEACGVDAAVAVASGTAALHLSCLALGVEAGREVIVPTLSFVATANAVLLAGGTPVFADCVGPDDLTVDPAEVERRITPATVGVLPMHYGGYSCRMDELLRICRRHGLFLLEDAAHAPGGKWNGKSLGTIGDAGCFSFFGNKNLTTGEGGIVVARDPAVLDRIRLLRSHGMTSLSWDRHEGHAWDYQVSCAGFNYRPTEVTGALGSIQLGKLEANNARRRRILEVYRERLAGVEGVEVPFPGRQSTGHICVILLSDASRSLPLRRHLAEEGIQTSLHYPPIHLFDHYRSSLGTGPGDFPVAEEVASRAVTLPLYPGLAREEVNEICDLIAAFLRGS